MRIARVKDGTSDPGGVKRASIVCTVRRSIQIFDACSPVNGLGYFF
jgi:hypothetical protein